MNWRTRHALWCIAGLLAALGGFALSVAYPLDFAPSHGPVREQSICNPKKPQAGCVPLERLT